MAKIYLVHESDATDYEEVVCAFFDESKCDEYIAERFAPREKELKLIKRCDKCKGNCYGHEGTYKFAKTCPNASIKTDRNGDYCENDASHLFYWSNNFYYTKSSVEIMDAPTTLNNEICNKD